MVGSRFAGLTGPTVPLPRDVPLNPNRTIAELNGIAARHTGAWIFLYATPDYDPQFLVARWLSHNAYRAFDDWAVTGRLQYYRFDRDSSLTTASTSLEFGDSIHLAGYQWDGRDAAAGDTIPIAFQWTRPSEHGPRLRVST